MPLKEVLLIMSTVKTLDDCKRTWEVQAAWLRDYPDDEVVIDEGEALWMHEQALRNQESAKQTERVA